MKKQTKKQLQDFNNKAIEIMEFYEAKRTDSDTNYFDSIMYEMNSDKIGRLVITLSNFTSRVYTIYTRFEDPKKAKRYFNCNIHNGKYNIYEFSPHFCLFLIDNLLDNYNKINGIDKRKEYLTVNNTI